MKDINFEVYQITSKIFLFHVLAELFEDILKHMYILYYILVYNT